MPERRISCWSGEADAEAENQLLEQRISCQSGEADAETENQFWSGKADAGAVNQFWSGKADAGAEKQMRGQRSRCWSGESVFKSGESAVGAEKQTLERRLLEWRRRCWKEELVACAKNQMLEESGAKGSIRYLRMLG